MKEVIITNPLELDKQKWAEFVYNHPLGNIYQTPYFSKIYKNTKNYQPINIIIKKDEEIVGVLLAVIINEGSGIKRNITSRSILIGGPLAKKNDEIIIKRLLIEYEKYIGKKVIYTEIREIFNLPYNKTIRELNYKAERRINILINLKPCEDILWQEVHSKRKNEIRKAAKKGVIVKEFNDVNTLKESYLILKEVYSRAKLPFADISYFMESRGVLGSERMLRFWGAFLNEILIGTMYTLCYRDRVIDWYAGSKYEHYNKNPNDILPWEVIKSLKQEGFKIFDFGGAGKPNIPYGVRDYKKKFGGEFIDLSRYQKIHKPLLMQIGKIGLSLWQRVK